MVGTALDPVVGTALGAVVAGDADEFPHAASDIATTMAMPPTLNLIFTISSTALVRLVWRPRGFVLRKPRNFRWEQAHAVRPLAESRAATSKGGLGTLPVSGGPDNAGSRTRRGAVPHVAQSLRVSSVLDGRLGSLSPPRSLTAILEAVTVSHLGCNVFTRETVIDPTTASLTLSRPAPPPCSAIAADGQHCPS